MTETTNNRAFSHDGASDVEAKYAAPSFVPAPVYSAPTIANPGPLGLSSFALTTFVLSLHNAGAGVAADGPSNVVVGLAFFYGGIVQVNTFSHNFFFFFLLLILLPL
jgi:succinate-acetate transporter protein